jgi:hypothetical protein
MSVAGNLEERGRVARRRSTRAAENVLRNGMLVVGAWFWGTIILTSVVIAAVQGWFGGLDGGTLQYTLGSARWFMFSLGLILAATTLPMHLAAGGTRRSFVDGLIRSSVFVGLATGIVTAVLLLTEELAWGWIGWDWQYSQGLVPEGSFAITAASETLVIATYILIGAMLPAGYQRFGAWGGSLWVLVLLFLVIFVDWAVHTGYVFGWDTLADAGPGRTLVGLGCGVLAVVIAAFGVDRLYRGVPLRSVIG